MEQMFAKVKTRLHKAAAPTCDALCDEIDRVIKPLSTDECRNFIVTQAMDAIDQGNARVDEMMKVRALVSTIFRLLQLVIRAHS